MWHEDNVEKWERQCLSNTSQNTVPSLIFNKHWIADDGARTTPLKHLSLSKMEICTTKASLLEKNTRMFEKEDKTDKKQGKKTKQNNYGHSVAFLWEVSCPQLGDPCLLPTGVIEHLRNPFWHRWSELQRVPFETVCPSPETGWHTLKPFVLAIKRSLSLVFGFPSTVLSNSPKNVRAFKRARALCKVSPRRNRTGGP